MFEEVNGLGRLLNDEEGPGWASLDVNDLDWLVSGVDVILGLLLLIAVLPFDDYLTTCTRIGFLTVYPVSIHCLQCTMMMIQ